MLEHLEIIGRLRGLSATVLKNAIRRLVSVCGLASFLKQPAGVLSKGCRQRLGLAGALIHEPAVLILDEPTTGLDPFQIRDIRALLAELGERRTVLVSTHLLDQVAEICQRILVLDKGRLRYDGPPQRLARPTTAKEARLIVDREPETVAQLSATFPFVKDLVLESAQDGFHSYRLHGTFDNQAMDTVFQFLAQQSWRVTHWAPLRPSLEDRFLQWAQGDVTP